MSNITATLFVDTTTNVVTFDRLHPDLTDLRVTGLTVGDLILYFGMQADADIATVTARLISALRELHEAAETRMARTLPTADDMLALAENEVPA